MYNIIVFEYETIHTLYSILMMTKELVPCFFFGLFVFESSQKISIIC